jgi:cysteine desulfurase
MMNQSIYLDYSATTPVDPRVINTMLPYFDQQFGNPSSIHRFGQEAEAAVQNSRNSISSNLNCQQNEIVFTSCGSESDNLALRGLAFTERKSRAANQIFISPVEHHAVSKTTKQLAEYFDFELRYLPIDEFGRVKINSLNEQLNSKTAFVSVIYANNEIGTVNRLSEIASICHQHGVPLHTDAVQAPAYLLMDVEELHVDLMSIGAHKFYGPKGVGLLYIQQNIKILPTLTGGGQENSMRAGTHNVPYIIGMAEALKIAKKEQKQRIDHVLPLRDYLIENVLNNIPNSRLTGHPIERLPNHASFVFKNVDGNNLLMLLDLQGFSCSSGSACRSGNPKPSDTLTAIGLPDNWALGSLRITLGTGTTFAQIEKFLEILPTAVENAKF